MKSEELMAREDSEPTGMWYKLTGTHFTMGKIKFDETSGVQKVQNHNNCGIPWNSEQIYQPRC
jgi:hypothetical protein